jgi:AmiR/NasT family two-component response regulator
MSISTWFLELLAAQLQSALNSRIVIEQAKGVLSERRQINVDEAFTLLREHARTHNRRLSDVARDVAEGSSVASDLLQTSGR